MQFIILKAFTKNEYNTSISNNYDIANVSKPYVKGFYMFIVNSFKYVELGSIYIIFGKFHSNWHGGWQESLISVEIHTDDKTFRLSNWWTTWQQNATKQNLFQIYLDNLTQIKDKIVFWNTW
jgi:hypothetical protein